MKMHATFRYDAHPMGMITAAFAALGTIYPEQNPALAGQDMYFFENKNLDVAGGGPQSSTLFLFDIFEIQAEDIKHKLATTEQKLQSATSPLKCATSRSPV